mgnify:CR=1 FL=1
MVLSFVLRRFRRWRAVPLIDVLAAVVGVLLAIWQIGADFFTSLGLFE